MARGARAWTLTSAPIANGPPALSIAVTWDRTAVSLYLDGKRVAVADSLRLRCCG